MSDELERFDAEKAMDVCGNFDVLMRQRHDGLFVRFADHEQALAALEARFKEHTSAVGRFLLEMYQTMVDPLEDSGLKVAEVCELLLHQAREDREKLNRSPANFPADWNQDSSLETWFPLTAEEFSWTKIALAASQQQVAALEARNRELESGWNRALDKWNAANDKRSELIDANQRLKAPVSDAEWQNLCDVVIFGQSADGLMSLSREGIDALLAARAALNGAS